MIEAKDLRREFGDIAAVRGVSFSVKKGEILGFLGPNGAGKTTTMRMLTGFLSPTSGTAEIAGFDILTHPQEAKRRIGYLPETPPLYLDHDTTTYLSFIADIRGIPRAEKKSQIEWVIERCGLKDVRKRLIHNLSKGYKQRVGLAQAIIHKPDVLILDEPTVGLDPSQIREIRELIKELSLQHTIILSTHILPEVSMICNRAIMISKGRIVIEGSIAQITKDRSLEEAFLEIIKQDDFVLESRAPESNAGVEK